MPEQELPIFPLHTVLFPGGELPLRIFELRYRRLVDICGKDSPFVVVRIREGREVGETAFTYEVGTRVFFEQLVSQRDGTLGAIAIGERRVRLSHWRVEGDGLMFARAAPMSSEEYVPVPEDLRLLAEALEEQGHAVPDAGMLAWRIADGLPLDGDTRQALLEEDDGAARLECVRNWLLRHPGWFKA
ncbi:MAG: peptidase lon protein [Moraxellaceae bacterium]|jgi:Lon protease-like protein|nr:peptidase lon protein [Moraxellaceae bacterium]MDF3031427.1 peptidase lon protein [Moraxellaceae bacterium]